MPILLFRRFFVPILALALALLLAVPVRAQWTPTGGPPGGSMSELVQVGSSLLVSAGNGGVYRSRNEGITWELVIDGLPCAPSVQALAASDGTAYVSIYGMGVYRTQNEGDTWEPANTGIGSLTSYTLFASGDWVLAADANGGAYVSPDRGVSWANRSSGLGTDQIQAFAFHNNRWYAGSRSLYESVDSGVSWQPVPVPGLSPNGVDSMVSDGTRLFLGTDTAIYFALTPGTGWQTAGVGIMSSVPAMRRFGNRTYAAVADGSYWVTGDGGANWAGFTNPLTRSFAWDIFETASGLILMSGSEGVYASDDGGLTWQLSSQGIAALQVRSLGASAAWVFAGTDNQGIFRSPDGGVNWEPVNTGLDAANSRTIYDIVVSTAQVVIATGGGVYESTDSGLTWNRKLNPGINRAVQAIYADSGVWMAAVSGVGVRISSDGTDTWINPGNSGLDTDTSYSDLIRSGPNWVLATENGEVYVSADQGNSWQAHSPGTGFILTHAFAEADGVLYAAGTQGLWTSTDNGLSWSRFNSGMQAFYDVLVANGLVYAFAETGVYVAETGGGQWVSYCAGMGQRPGQSLWEGQGRIYAGAFDSGVWYSDILDALPSASEGITVLEPLEVCEGDSPFLLDTYLPPGISGGTWLHDPSGRFDPATDTSGTYVYSLGSLCNCQAEYRIFVDVGGLGSAGEDASVSWCEAAGILDLFLELGGSPEPGGTWSPALSSGSGAFNPLSDPPGTYTYTVSTSCGPVSASVGIALVGETPLPEGDFRISTNFNDLRITVGLPDFGEFEYALAGMPFRQSGPLQAPGGGTWTVQIRQVGGCGVFEQEVNLLVFPKFFTPNGDGIHERWQLEGALAQGYDLLIFDRYGKLMIQLRAGDPGWDGRFQGRPVPESDYWFLATFEDGARFQGHFSLVR